MKVLFAENPGVVIQVRKKDAHLVQRILDNEGIGFIPIGHPIAERKLIIRKRPKALTYDIDRLRDIWYETSHLLDRRQSLNGMADARFENYKKQPVVQRFPKTFTGRLAQYGLDADR